MAFFDAMSPPVLRYHWLVYCNLDTLLRLNHVNRSLRAVLNDPSFVSEWLTLCWFTEIRHCRCDREQFLVDLLRWCPFVWDYRGGDRIRVPRTASEVGNPDGCMNLREMQLILRHLGRSLPMLLQSLSRPLSVPTVRYPYETPHGDFCPGMHEDLFDGLMIPLPRMVHVPVECTRIQRNAFDPDAFWGGFHEVTDEMLEDAYDIKTAKQELPPRYGSVPALSSSFDASDYVDQVEAYIEQCRDTDQDPHDPNEDTERMDGYRAEQWARHLLYESAVGLQTFPLNLCVHREDLRGMAYRNGPNYLERRFVSAMAYEGHRGESELLGLHGAGLFYNIRYDNERGDFHTWCLSTMATLQATYHHLWHDYARRWLHNLRVYVLGLSQEIQQDLPIGQLCPRWRRLMQQWFVHHPDQPANIGRPVPLPTLVSVALGHAESPPSLTACQRDRDRHALRFLMDQEYRTEFLVVQRNVESWLHRPFPMASPFNEPYLRDIIPNPTWDSGLYPESALLTDAEHLLRVSEFLLEFAHWVGPRVDPGTRSLRRRMHRLYLNSAVSLFVWAPHWHRLFSDGYRHGDVEQPHVPLRLMRLNPQNNHRYWHYLDFLNRRALFHHPDPETWYHEHRWGMDIGRMLRS